MERDALDGLTHKERILLTQARELLKKLFKTRGAMLLNDVAVVGSYLQSYYADKRDREEFSVLYLDVKYRLISHRMHSVGLVDYSATYPAVIVREALLTNASAIIVAHNHPSGCSQPSPMDIKNTEHLKAALSPLNIQLLDHFIVGERVTSMRQEGML